MQWTTFVLDARPEGQPLHEWVYGQLRGAILERRLGPGVQLPSTRALAEQLGVARGTLVVVFERLASEGYLEGRGGSGTFVTRDLPDAWFEVKKPAQRARPGVRASSLSSFGRTLAVSPFPTASFDTARPFRPYLSALDEFPHDVWSRILARHARTQSRLVMRGGDSAGLPVLREAIAAHVRTSRGLRCTAEHVVVTSGGQQSLDLMARLVLDRGDAAWIEEPGYIGARVVLEAAGAVLVPVPVDEHGLQVELGVVRGRDAKLAYVTPAHQAPLGVTLRADRRLELLEWAGQHGAWIFEDDYDSEYRYESRPVPALAALDRRGVVVHAGTFSKTLFAGLRIAYVIAPDALVDRFVAAKSILDRFTPPFVQAALAELMIEGHFTRHLRRMRQLYAERRSVLLAAIARELPEWLEPIGAEAGIDLAAWLPVGIDDVYVSERLAAAGIEAHPLSAQARLPMQRGGLLLGFAAFPPARLRKAVVAMRRVSNDSEPGADP